MARITVHKTAKKSKPKCVNRGETHTANWKGCSAYKKVEAPPKKVPAVQRIQQKSMKKATSDVSHAQMASSSNTTDKTSNKLMQQQSKKKK